MSNFENAGHSFTEAGYYKEAPKKKTKVETKTVGFRIPVDRELEFKARIKPIIDDMMNRESKPIDKILFTIAKELKKQKIK